MLWAFCLSLYETLRVVTSTSVQFITPADILWIIIVLIVSYTIIWGGYLVVASAAIKKYIIENKNINIILFYWCFAFFSYRLFWILGKMKTEGLGSSMSGILINLFAVVSAILISYAIYKIIEFIRIRWEVKDLELKIVAIGISLTGYILLFAFLKSKMTDGKLGLFYSFVLLIVFLFMSKLVLLLLNKLKLVVFKTGNHEKMKHTLSTITILFIFISLIFGYNFDGIAQNNEGNAKPNVLFISIDTLRADRVSSYNEINKKLTPNIDKIAESGYIFKRAYSTTSWTLPAHASMFTGLFPSSHGADRSINQTARRPVDPLIPSIPTLAEILKNNGYQTAGVISVPYLSRAFNMDKGFEFYDDQIDVLENIAFITLNENAMLFKLMQIANIIKPMDYDSDRAVTGVNEKAFKWLVQNKNHKKPFFLFLHYFEPHFVYKPPEPFNKADDGRKLEYFTDIDTLNRGQYSLSSYGIKDLIALYDGEVSYLDIHIGNLFNKLKKWDILDNTLVIITSDHGESFNEHEIWTHGNSLYEEQIRVPLIMRFPNLIKEGQVDNQNIVQIIDIMPTILDFLDIPVPNHIHGRSLVPIFNGDKDRSFELAFAEIKPDINWKAKNERFGDDVKTVVKKEWKYILYQTGREELFNLSNDPGEEKNLAKINKNKATELKKILLTWSDSTQRVKRDDQKGIDAGKLEQLRSLGYFK